MDNITQTLMRGAGSGGGSAAPTDPNFNQVALLLHGDGTNGAQNNTFVDSSTNNFSITRNGNATQGTYSPFSLPDGQWSNFFDGNGSSTSNTDRLDIANNSALQFGSSDFTAETWFYLTAAPTQSFIRILDKGSTSTSNAEYLLMINSTTQGLFQYSSNGTTLTDVTFTSTFTVNSWHHLAVTRSGTTLTVWHNGSSIATATINVTLFAGAATLYIGNRAGNDRTFPGYLSNLRIVNGTAVYTSTFTPPTAPLTAISGTSLLTCQSNRLKDNSSNNFTLTRNGDVRVTAFSPFAPTGAYSTSVNGGSGYFDGNGDNLTVSDSVAYDFGSDSFTIEGWFYRVGNNKIQTILRGDNGATSGVGLDIGFNASNTLEVRLNGGTSTMVNASISTTNAVPFSWHHLAFVRNSNTWTIYVNGVSVASATNSSTVSNPTFYRVCGNSFSATMSFDGYVSSFRVVKGTAVYTADFTPPAAPLTAITNTSLLLNFTNAGIVDSAAKFDIETVGDAQIDTTITKYGTGALEFDGTGDGLKATGIRVLPSGREAYTIEFWMWLNNNSSIMTPVTYGTPSTNLAMIVQIRTSGVVRLSNFGNDLDSPTSSVTASTWHHVACQYDGTNRRIFVDGVQIATDTTTAVNVAATDVCLVGVSLATTNYFNGYIDDLRITKGVARYTSAGFTPPSAPYPDL